MLLLSLGFSAERERAFNSEMNSHQSERAKMRSNEIGLQQTHPKTEHERFLKIGHSAISTGMSRRMNSANERLGRTPVHNGPLIYWTMLQCSQINNIS